jgi:hypothetical protein
VDRGQRRGGGVKKGRVALTPPRQPMRRIARDAIAAGAAVRTTDPRTAATSARTRHHPQCCCYVCKPPAKP